MDPAGGAGAVAVASVSDGGNTEVSLISGGAGYSSSSAGAVLVRDPSDTEQTSDDAGGSGGSASGAAATATIENDAVTAITITSGGSG